MAVSTSDELNWRVERACAAAWPAADERAVDTWIVRRSGGGTRRTNSASAAHRHATLDPATLSKIESLFAAHRQPAIFRVSSLVPAIDAALDEAGYAPAEGRTHTCAAELSGGHRRDAAATIADRPGARWRAARMRLSRAVGAGERDHVDAVDRLRVPAIFARVEAGDETRAVAYAALVGEPERRGADAASLTRPIRSPVRGASGIRDDGGSTTLAVIEAVVTDPAYRRRGLARACVGSLLAAAHEAGARSAVLQVAADNAPALALYAQLGFTRTLYDYHYRRRA